MQSDRIHGGALICSVEASNIRDHHDSFQRTFPIEIRFFLTLKNWPQLLAEASRAILTCFRFGQQWQIKPFLSGAFAYLISSPAAAKALDLSKTIVAPVDDFLFSPLSPFTNRVFAYRVIPALVTTDEVTIVSTIGNRVSELSRSPWWIRHHPYRTYVKAKVWLNRLTAHREIIRAVD